MGGVVIDCDAVFVLSILACVFLLFLLSVRSAHLRRSKQEETVRGPCVHISVSDDCAIEGLHRLFHPYAHIHAIVFFFCDLE